MRIVASSDWRDAIPFESPVLVADVVPGEPTRCFACGASSEPRPRTELWAFKHRHPKNHDGYVRFYCAAHVPQVARPMAAPGVVRGSSRTAREPAQRRSPRPSAPEKQRAMCPNCFVEVSATGACGICGWSGD